MLNSFDWLRRSQSGAELLATLNYLAEEADFHDPNEDVEIGPVIKEDGQRFKPIQNMESTYRKKLEAAKADWEQFQEFLGYKRKSVFSYVRNVIFVLFLPALGTATLLFYGLENPIMFGETSASWFVLALWRLS